MPKYTNVDVIDFLDKIVKENTHHYQTDFEYDKKILLDSVKDTRYQDNVFLWMSRPSGTQCLSERNTYIRGTREYCTWCYYGEQDREGIIAYAIEVLGTREGVLIGNLYKLDYEKHYQHVMKDAVDASETTILVYEHGEIEESDLKKISSIDLKEETELGKFQYFRMLPKELEKFEILLKNERIKRNHLREAKR